MDVSSLPDLTGQIYSARVAKLSLNALKTQGEGAVELIQSASTQNRPPVGINGEGSLLNTYG